MTVTDLSDEGLDAFAQWLAGLYLELKQRTAGAAR